MKHLVQLLVREPKRFNRLGLSTYKDEKGRRVEYTDINGDVLDKFVLNHPSLILDISEEQDRKLYEFIKGHPLNGKSYDLTDMRAQEEQEVEDLLESSNAILVASKMGIAETNDFARLVGISLDADQDIIKARLIKMANTSPQKFMDMYNHPEKKDIIFLRKAIERGIITRANGAYKHNKVTMGLTEEATIVWLKENADVYALMKQELRGNVSTDIEKPKKTKA